MCKICFVNKANMAFVPCGHMSICEGCAEFLPNKNKCIICRGRATTIQKIFI